MAKLVQITPITMVCGTYNYSYWGESKPTYNWGAPHCIDHTKKVMLPNVPKSGNYGNVPIG